MSSYGLLILGSPSSDQKGLSWFYFLVWFDWTMEVEKFNISLSRPKKNFVD